MLTIFTWYIKTSIPEKSKIPAQKMSSKKDLLDHSNLISFILSSDTEIIDTEQEKLWIILRKLEIKFRKQVEL